MVTSAVPRRSAVLALVISLPLTAAQVRAEPVLISCEAQAALALTPPQSQWFGPGAAAALAVQLPQWGNAMAQFVALGGVIVLFDAPSSTNDGT